MKLKAEEKAALQARVKTLKDELLVYNAKKDSGSEQEQEENKAQIAIRESELEASQGKLDNDELEEKTVRLEAALLEQRTKDADAEVKAAVGRGAIAIKDEEQQEIGRAHV